MTNLVVRNLNKRFGGLHVLRGVNFEINGAELIGLIGPNGAGKTTLTNILDGAIKPNSGTVYLNGKRIDQLQPYEVARAGLGRTFQITRSFRRMTVLENLQMGGANLSVAEFGRYLSWVQELFPMLAERGQQLGGTLSGGEQQMLAIGRALMSKPRLLLMDEPSLGLAPLISRQIFEIIEEINKRGTTILLVEQNAYAALRLANRARVLSTGEIVVSGDAQELMDNPEVQEAYLGG